jgi:hypothetical protein
MPAGDGGRADGGSGADGNRDKKFDERPEGKAEDICGGGGGDFGWQHWRGRGAVAIEGAGKMMGRGYLRCRHIENRDDRMMGKASTRAINIPLAPWTNHPTFT